jgi:thioredoxin-like negative regulator of GroEL
MSREILNGIDSMAAFYDILRENPGIVIIKFGAEWCAPCRKIESVVHQWFDTIHANIPTIQLIYVDVDESFEIYAQLKTKKMIQGIPAILAYYQGNTTYIFDDCVNGTDEGAIASFFERCRQPTQKN